MNPGALPIEPQLTLKWTPTNFEMNPGALFSKFKKTNKKINLSKTKTKTRKASNLKIYLLFCGKKLIFSLGIPLKEVYLMEN